MLESCIVVMHGKVKVQSLGDGSKRSRCILGIPTSRATSEVSWGCVGMEGQAGRRGNGWMMLGEESARSTCSVKIMVCHVDKGGDVWSLG
jgi:hypothetical protein